MAYTIAWENAEQTVIRITYRQRWTWEDARAAQAETNDMLDSVSHFVTILLCWESDNWLPPGYEANVTMMLEQAHPAIEQIVIVRKNPLFHQFFRQYAETHPVPFQYAFATSIEEAKALVTARTGG